MTGCSSTPAPTPTPTALIAGKFATEEEALAAAKEVYRKYAALSEAYAANPAEELPALKAITSSDMYDFEADFADLLIERGYVLRGSLTYENYKFLRADETLVSFEMCANNAGARLINSQGIDVTDDSDSPFVPMSAAIDFGKGGPVVETVDSGGAEICAGK